MNKRLSFASCLAALVIVPALASMSAAQTVVDFLPTDADPPGNWIDNMNWSAGAFPDGRFDESANIDSGGIAFINSAVANGPVALAVGATSGLEVRSGGSITVDGASTINGALTVQDNGALESQSLTFGGGSNFAVDFTAGTGTPISVTGNSLLNGTLDIDLSGVSNPLGSFTLIDTGSAVGGFGTINTVGLGTGQTLQVNNVAGGNNGVLVQANVLNVLTLQVNRVSGAVSIQNTHGSAVTLDGFRVNSDLGGLNPGSANPLAAGWESSAANSANNISQLFLGSSPDENFSVGGGNTIAVGNGVYQPVVPAEFGQDTEDVVFQYTDVDSTSTINGLVEYVGAPKVENNFVLTIDDSGAATIQNTSPFFSPAIEAYRITSESGSLITGTWNQVEDSFGNTWSASQNSDENSLLEVQEDGTTTFATGAGFELGTIFAGTEDVVFEYLLAGGNELSEGVVVYGDLPDDITDPVVTGNESIPGDFDGSGSVGGDDLSLLLTSWGDVPGPGWVNNVPITVGGDSLSDLLTTWGQTSGATGVAAASVPEPNGLVLFVLAVGCLALVVSPRRQLCPVRP